MEVEYYEGFNKVRLQIQPVVELNLNKCHPEQSEDVLILVKRLNLNNWNPAGVSVHETQSVLLGLARLAGRLDTLYNRTRREEMAHV